jgi:hypothetical protein
MLLQCFGAPPRLRSSFATAEYRSVTRSLSGWGPKEERGCGFFEAVEVDLMIRLVHDNYHRWERDRIFLKAIEVDLTIGLVYDSYRRWERGRRFLLWIKISCSPDFIVVDMLIVEYLLDELIASQLLILQASLFGS